MVSIKEYYALVKPGIVRGNLIVAVAGYLFASRWHINVVQFFALAIGVSFIIASGCVFNNYLDRHIDKKMARTRERALVVASISSKHALVFGTVLGILGLGALVLFTNYLTAILGLIGWIFYVYVYAVAKRYSVHSTLVGSIPGAFPPVAGYTAVTGRIDMIALLLFLVLVTWQMAHFYSIAIFRIDEYASAGLPIMSVRKGVSTSKTLILWYIAAFVIVNLLFASVGKIGFLYYAAAMGIVGITWLRKGILSQKYMGDAIWARTMFRYSLFALMIFSVLISIEPFL